MDNLRLYLYVSVAVSANFPPPRSIDSKTHTSMKGCRGGSWAEIAR